MSEKDQNKEALRVLVAEMKKAGLNVGEDAAKSLVKALFKAIPAAALITPNKIDDLVIAVLPVIEPQVIKLLDGIDGEVDEE
jgi:hypothetical protein